MNNKSLKNCQIVKQYEIILNDTARLMDEDSSFDETWGKKQRN